MKGLGIGRILLALALLGSVSVQAEEAYDVEWIKQFGTTDRDYGRSVAVDNNGNIFVTGFTQGEFDGETKIGGYYDSYITKFNSSGVLLWTKQFGTTEKDKATSITINSKGNLFIAGKTQGAFDGGISDSRYYDYFIIKYDTNGSLIWNKQFGRTGYVFDGITIACDSNDNLFVGGDSTTIRKFDTNGALLWSRQFGTTRTDHTTSITTDNDGNIFITGNTLGTFNGELRIASGWATDAFIIKYSNDGTFLWNRQFGTLGYDTPVSITADTSGNIFIGGYTSATINGAINIYYNDATIVKYNSNGTLLWNRQFGAYNHDFVTSITTDNSGNPIVTGYNSAGSFVTKYNSEGLPLWNNQLSGYGIYAYSIFAHNSNLFITGNSRRDAFLAKLSSPNTAPVALATTPEAIVIDGSVVSLDGTQSYDVDGDNITYLWYLVEKPLDSTAEISDLTSATPVFTADTIGNYLVSLTVNDGNVDSDPVNVSIEAITIQTAAINLIEQAIQELLAMPDSSFSNKNHKKTLINKLNVVVKMLASSKYQNSIYKLQNDILPKINETDWIISAGDQVLIYDLIAKTIGYLQNDINH